MALTFHLNIVSAEALIFSGPASRVVLPAVTGEVCILARHAPLLTRLRPGLARLTTQFDEEQTLFVSSGFQTVERLAAAVDISAKLWGCRGGSGRWRRDPPAPQSGDLTGSERCPARSPSGELIQYVARDDGLGLSGR